jgi:hypothetical protein
MLRRVLEALGLIHKPQDTDLKTFYVGGMEFVKPTKPKKRRPAYEMTGTNKTEETT